VFFFSQSLLLFSGALRLQARSFPSTCWRFIPGTPSGPFAVRRRRAAIAVDSATNKVYVNGLADTLTMIDGKALTATHVGAPPPQP